MLLMLEDASLIWLFTLILLLLLKILFSDKGTSPEKKNVFFRALSKSVFFTLFLLLLLKMLIADDVASKYCFFLFL